MAKSVLLTELGVFACSLEGCSAHPVQLWCMHGAASLHGASYRAHTVQAANSDDVAVFPVAGALDLCVRCVRCHQKAGTTFIRAEVIWHGPCLLDEFFVYVVPQVFSKVSRVHVQVFRQRQDVKHRVATT